MPNESHYHSAKHRKWRERVLKKDKYLCQECLRFGVKTPATHAHHKKPVKDFPELAYKVENGVALCTACHNKIEPRPPLSRKNRVGGR